MDIYLVGGAVRDRLLNLTVTDHDWVVVGAKPKQLLDQGYRPVGKDFPVFLHPQTHEEYALARTERKTSPGYTGFEVDSSESVTLEEDLERRDLTINAMAETQSGEIVDPYHGQRDLEQRWLRHVSAAFSEDPVRILRVARFAARYAHLEFKVHPSTLELMIEMVNNGEVDHLVPERIWAETQRALAGIAPHVFFETLRSCGALARIFPELEALYGVPQPAKWHPEIDTGVHTMLVVQQACLLSDSPEVRFAALVHDLGKAETPKDIWPSHYGHELASVELVKKMCKRLAIPNRYRDLALIVAEHHGKVHRVFELKANTLVKLFSKISAFRQPERLPDFLLACEADARGRTGLETQPYPQRHYIQQAFDHACQVSTEQFADGTMKGPQIAEALYLQRLNNVRQFINTYQEQHRRD